MRNLFALGHASQWSAAVAVTLALAVGCGDSENTNTTGASGRGGSQAGGTGGVTGTGGATGSGTGGVSGSGGTGGSGASGGTGGSGGTTGSGGSAGSTATGGSAGAGAMGGSAGSGGTAGKGGAAGSGGTAGSGGAAGKAGAAGSGGTAGSAGKAGSGGADGGVVVEAGTDAAGPSGDGGAHFSFFMTSLAALRRLSGSQDGFGGDLRFGKTNGLDGADEICRQIAETSSPGNGKTWRAFLSVTVGPNGTAVNAIDRIGDGPWYDRNGRVLAMTKAALLNARPQGADPAILNDLPNEDGVPNHNPDGTIIDNHNVLTGSNTSGAINSTNKSDTCQDWTSSVASGGKPRCGVSWPRSSLINWISVLNEGGCAPGVTPPGADSGASGTVGALGGYGGFYCFALTP